MKKDVEMAKQMSDYVNSMGNDYYDFAKQMSCEHRTLQQSFTKLCVAWLKQLADTNYYDLRNENSVLFAKSIKEELESSSFPMI